MNYEIKIGDSLEVLKTMDEQSVHCCVTSPPYWALRDYGTATWEGGDPECVHRRNNKIGKNCITGHKNHEEMRGVGDTIYKKVCQKCGAKRIDDQLGLEETPEEYVENLVDILREVKRVLRDDGTLWLNLGDSYVGTGAKGKYKDPKSNSRNAQSTTAINNKVQGLKPKDMVGIPWRVAFALQADGWYLRSDIIWHKNNCMPSPVRDRPTSSHEFIFLLSKSPKYYYDKDAILEPLLDPDRKEGTGRGSGFGGYKHTSQPDKTMNSTYSGRPYDPSKLKGKNKRDVWTVGTAHYKGSHVAVYPPKLIEPCILAGCPDGGTVLDPFSGSGTTGVVALQNNKKYIGIELSPEYAKLSEDRINDSCANLFGVME